MIDLTRPALRRDLGTWGAISIVVGTVIGSGIFLVPKAMILRVGSPEMLFLVWVFGGILTLFGALTYAELAAAFPDAGGEYVYLKEAYGPFFGFLYAWTQTWVAKSASMATLATALFYYLGNFYPGLDKALLTLPWHIGPHGTPFEIRYGQLLAMGIILLLGFLNYFGVKLGGHVQIIITVIKVGLIAGIVVIGLGSGTGSAANYSSSIPAAGGFAGFFAALVAALWAYDGWNNVGMVASEIRNPQRNLPIALIGGTLLVIAIYLAANLAYFFVLSSREVAGADRVAAEMMRRVLGQKGADAVSVAAMVSIFAALNGSILSGSRVPYAAARDGYFFRSFGNVNEKYRTPGLSLMFLCMWSALLVLSGYYEQLFTLVIFPSWILYAMATASVLVLRRTRPNVERPYRTFGYPFVPVLFVLVALVLIFQTLRESPRESLLGLVIIMAGLPFYFYWKRRPVR